MEDADSQDRNILKRQSKEDLGSKSKPSNMSTDSKEPDIELFVKVSRQDCKDFRGEYI